MARSDAYSTHEAKQKFLASFAKYGNVAKAARAANVERSTPYKWGEADPEFAEAWESAREAAADVLEGEAFRRAVTGLNRDVFYQGEKIATERHYSDALLTLLLKANRPDKYRERSQVDHSGSVQHAVKYIAGLSEDDI